MPGASGGSAVSERRSEPRQGPLGARSGGSQPMAPADVKVGSGKLIPPLVDVGPRVRSDTAGSGTTKSVRQSFRHASTQRPGPLRAI